MHFALRRVKVTCCQFDSNCSRENPFDLTSIRLHRNFLGCVDLDLGLLHGAKGRFLVFLVRTLAFIPFIFAYMMSTNDFI